LLSSSDVGRYWKRPVTLTSGTAHFQFSVQQASGKAYWVPNYFSSYVPASQINEKVIRHPDRQEGIGGALVGIRKATHGESFVPRIGLAAPVTSTLEFKNNRATLLLHNPVESSTAMVQGVRVPLQADYSAPLALHPQQNELLHGFLSMIQIEKYMARTGLYFLEPYDPDKIPVIFVHGLMSTGYMWRNVANEVLSDPELRRQSLEERDARTGRERVIAGENLARERDA